MPVHRAIATEGMYDWKELCVQNKRLIRKILSSFSSLLSGIELVVCEYWLSASAQNRVFRRT